MRRYQTGLCDPCFDASVETVAEAEKPPKVRPSKVRFSEHFRYTLTRRKHGQWTHCNPDMQRWRQGQIIERVSYEAVERGYESWVVLGVDETMLAQGVVNAEHS